MNNQTTTIAYDYENRITQITYPNSSTDTFTYNALDTRVGKVDSGGTKTYKRDGADVADDVLADGASVFTPGVSVRNSGSTKFLHGDQLGSFSRETDGTQTTTATKQYDAFGIAVSSTGTSVSPFGFAGGWGYQEDSDSGLKLLGHRYYDPSTGRFLTRDPAQDGRNWYAYCANDPYSYVDPDGCCVVWDWIKGGARAVFTTPRVAAYLIVGAIYVTVACCVKGNHSEHVGKPPKLLHWFHPQVDEAHLHPKNDVGEPISRGDWPKPSDYD